MKKPPVKPDRAPRSSRFQYVYYLFSRSLLSLTVLIIAITLYIGVPQVPTPSLMGADRPFNPEQPLLIDFSPLQLTLDDASLYEVPRDDLFGGPQQAVPVVLTDNSTSMPFGSLPWETRQVQITQPDGGNPLRPDAAFCLRLAGDWSPLSLLWLKMGRWREAYCFATEPSPKLVLPVGPLHPRFEQPVAIEWDMPVTGFSYRVSPFAPSSSSLDVVDPRRARLTLQGYVSGQKYEIEVLDAMGMNGVALQRPYSFTVVMPKPPRPRIESSTTLRFGETVLLAWDEPMVGFDYLLDPPAPSDAIIDPADRHQARISLQRFVQGQEYRVTVIDAVAENGLRLQQPYTFTLKTPAPLEVAGTTPGDGAFGVNPNQSICVAFDEAITDQVAAERSVAISPIVAGHFEWPSERKLCFVQAEAFNFDTHVNVSISGGPNNVRGNSGSYLENDVDFQFTIRPDKMIDVDLKRQTVRLFEGDRLFLTTLTSTGVKGAETPIGTYMVQYKMKSTRMRGVTPSGRTYDLPNVPWVLAFWDDYTIHGAYWRNGFGFPQSNGCVSLPVPVAEKIYNWAPVGTRIVIHY